jgi:hypothetical protein
MVKRFTVDSSIIISSLIQSELCHKEALKIWEGILSGKNFYGKTITPYNPDYHYNNFIAVILLGSYL